MFSFQKTGGKLSPTGEKLSPTFIKFAQPYFLLVASGTRLDRLRAHAAGAGLRIGGVLPDNTGRDGRKVEFIFGATIGQRPVRNLCSVLEALTGGLDETALARERKLEATADLAHGDERNRESLLLPNLQLGLLDS